MSIRKAEWATVATAAVFIPRLVGKMGFADDALTARNKAIFPDFYTTVLNDGDIDAAPREQS